MPKTKEPITVEYQTLVIIWGSLLLSQFLFAAIVFFVKPQLFHIDTTLPIMSEKPLIVLVFAIAGIVVFALSFILRNQYIRRAIDDRDAGCVQTGLALGCALSEMCSILGLILALAFNYQYFFFWIALGLIGILLHFPRKGNLDAANFQSLK
ncbi:MAG: hypothetical protein ABI791_11810 [Acidobacteriota bacterium]